MTVRKKSVALVGLTVVALLAVAWLALRAGPVRVPSLKVPRFRGARLSVAEQSVGKGCLALRSPSAAVSPDNRRVACILGPIRKWDDGRVELLEGRKRLAVDGVEGKPYDNIGSISFSPDSRRLAYVADRGKKHLVVVDGVEGPEWEWVYPAVWSPDSRRLAYVAQSYRELRYYAVVDGVRVDPDSERGMSVIVFSPDSRHWAAVAERGYANFLLFDGKQGSAYNSTHAYPTTMASFSPDGRRIAYIVGGSSRIWSPQSVVVESVQGLENKDKVEVQVGKVYDGGVGGPTFSPDSRRLAYVGTEGGKRVLVLDGLEDKRYESVSEPIFSPDSRRLAYAASRGEKQLAVIGGVEGSEYTSVELGRLFSPDGRRTAYRVSSYDEKTGWKQAAVIDGVLGRWYLSIVAPPVFSPDSAHAAYLAQRDDKKYVIVVDGGESQAYDDYAGDGRLVFDGPNLVRAVMVRNGEGLRVEIRIR